MFSKEDIERLARAHNGPHENMRRCMAVLSDVAPQCPCFQLSAPQMHQAMQETANLLGDIAEAQNICHAADVYWAINVLALFLGTRATLHSMEMIAAGETAEQGVQRQESITRRYAEQVAAGLPLLMAEHSATLRTAASKAMPGMVAPETPV